MPLWGEMESYKALEQHHNKLHAMGRDIVLSFDSGEKDKARTMFTGLQGTSGQIVSLLEKIKEECEAKG